MTPIFIVHKGNQKYLELSVRTCEKYHDVHLLGDLSNKGFADKWHNIDEIRSDYIVQFNSVYKHMSTNPEWFEKMCFYRYIYMYEYAKNNKIYDFFHCDSDIILLQNLDCIKHFLTDYLVGVMKPEHQHNYRYTASPHISYWTLDGLKEFIEFFLITYASHIDVLEEKYNYHVRHNIPGGVCDMTLLFLYSNSSSHVFNLFDLKCVSLDYNISSLESSCDSRLKSLFGLKRIKVINRDLYFLYDQGEPKIVLCLHMQGRAKKFMHDAYNKRYYLMMFKVFVLNSARKIIRAMRMNNAVAVKIHSKIMKLF